MFASIFTTDLKTAYFVVQNLRKAIMLPMARGSWCREVSINLSRLLDMAGSAGDAEEKAVPGMGAEKKANRNGTIRNLAIVSLRMPFGSGLVDTACPCLSSSREEVDTRRQSLHLFCPIALTPKGRAHGLQADSVSAPAATETKLSKAEKQV
eukprot:109035-Amphidinium_carterae.1